MIIWIKNGRLVDPVKGIVDGQDVVVRDKKIDKILPSNEFRAEDDSIKVIDASGMIVVPGLIDMHVHLREPGYEHKETILSGCMAGAAGGFTGLACMPNTDPVNDMASVTALILDSAHKADLINIYPIAAITMAQKGEILSDFSELKSAGAVGVSDDGFPVSNDEIMLKAIKRAKDNGLAIISHCEDIGLSASGVMHQGVVSEKIGLKSIPSASEECLVKREISLAADSGCPVHIAHVSTAGSVLIIKKAKEAGIPVTAETAPHYFSLDHTAVIGSNTNAKMNPPLRTPEDVTAIKQALAEDVIDVIATDHAPHSPAEKALGFEKAPFGIIGLETALPLTLALVREGVLSLPKAVQKLTCSPASILGIDRGRIKKGGYADLAIIDPEMEYILKKRDLLSKSENSPFIGKLLKGKNVLTMFEGRIVWERNV